MSRLITSDHNVFSMVSVKSLR